MINITSQLEEQLKEHRVDIETFRKGMCRLLSEGRLVRDESQVQTKLFDALYRAEDLAREVFMVFGIELKLEDDLKVYWIKAPSYDEEGKPQDEGLARRPGLALTTLLVGAWIEYEEAFRGGELTDEATAIVPMSKLSLTIASQLDRPLPEGIGELRSALKEACNLKAIKCNADEDIKSEKFLIEINPLITRMISAKDFAEVCAGPIEDFEPELEGDKLSDEEIFNDD